MNNNNAVTVAWFEIPTADMQRAIQFYETVFKTSLNHNKMGDFEMAIFPANDGKGAAGSLVYQKESYTPSNTGILVYLSSEDVNNELSRIEKAGGEILRSKTQISPEMGYMALFLDCEGNRIALHSTK